MLEESYKSSDTWKEILRQVTEISRQVRHQENLTSKIIEITNGMIQLVYYCRKLLVRRKTKRAAVVVSFCSVVCSHEDRL